MIKDVSKATDDYLHCLKVRKKDQGRKTMKEAEPLPRTNGQNGKVCKIIASYNFKGGVAKTTNTINTAASLAMKGYTTVVFDMDPQCNLTNFFLPPIAFELDADSTDQQSQADEEADSETGEQTEQDLAEPAVICQYDIKEDISPAVDQAYLDRVALRLANADIPDIYELLRAPFTGSYGDAEPPKKLLKLPDDVSCPQNLYIIPGNPMITDFEANLNLVDAQAQTAAVYLGAFRQLFLSTAEVSKADFILVDVGPSMSTLNQTILLSCDFLMPPVFADFFSLSSMHTLLHQMIPKLQEHRDRILEQEPRRLNADQKAMGFGFKKTFPKVLPFIVTNFTFKRNHMHGPSAEWVLSMRALVNDVETSRPMVANLFVKSNGEMVIPFIPNYGALTQVSHVFGWPVVCMDKPFFKNHVIPVTGGRLYDKESLWRRALKYKSKYATLVSFLSQL